MTTLVRFINNATGNSLIIDEDTKMLVDSGSKITEDSPWQARDFSSFYIRPGLANSAAYSFEAKMFPGYFLRSDGVEKVFLDIQVNTSVFNEASTFIHTETYIASVGAPSHGLSISQDGIVICMDKDSSEFSAVTYSQAEKRWKDSYTISFNYFGEQSAHLMLVDGKVGFKPFGFWEDFDNQSNRAGWYLDYPDNNTAYFTIQNVKDEKERFLAVGEDNESIELIDKATDDMRLLDKALWRAEAVSARGEYLIINKKVEAHSKNALSINKKAVKEGKPLGTTLSVLSYDALSTESVIFNIDERFIPTKLMLDDVKVANSLLRRSNGLTSQGLIIPITEHGGDNSWSVRRYKTYIEKNDDQGVKYRFVPHIGIDPSTSPNAKEWTSLKSNILELPVMGSFSEAEKNTIITLAAQHLGYAYRSHMLGEVTPDYTSGIIWLTPELAQTQILSQVESFIDYRGETLRSMSSVEGKNGFSAAFGFLLQRDDKGELSYTIGDPTSGETRPPDPN